MAPNLTQYNLLLRTVRDCELGDPDLASELLRRSAVPQPLLELAADDLSEQQMTDNHSVEPEPTNKDNLLEIHPISHEDVSDEIEHKTVDTESMHETEHKTVDREDIHETEPKTVVRESIHVNKETTNVDTGRHWWHYAESKDLVVKHEESVKQAIKPQGPSVLDMAVPNVLNPKGKYRQVVALGEMDHPSQRLALLGGLAGFLNHMVRDKAQASIFIFDFSQTLLWNKHLTKFLYFEN